MVREFDIVRRLPEISLKLLRGRVEVLEIKSKEQCGLPILRSVQNPRAVTTSQIKNDSRGLVREIVVDARAAAQELSHKSV